jgi:hypothetical protein
MSYDSSLPVTSRPKPPIRRRHALTSSLIGEARDALVGKVDTSFAIDNPRGLLIRVRNGEMAYYVQARGPSGVVKRKICAVGDVNISEIKIIATKTVAAMKNSVNIDVVIQAGLAKLSHKETEIALDRAEASSQNLLTFGEMIDQFTAPTILTNGVAKRKFKTSYLREISDRLRNRPEAIPLMSLHVKELRFDDLEKVRDEINSSGGGASSGAKFIDLAKRTLNWGAKYRRRLSGLDPMNPWWSSLAHEYKPSDRSDRFLTPEQVGTLMALLEGVRSVDDRSNDAVFGALQLDWLLIQRSGALVGMESLASHRWQIDPAPDRAGWIVYSWTDEEVKGNRKTKLSIPPVAIDIIKRVESNARNLIGISSNWAFPQCRNKYLLTAYASSNNAEAIRRLDKHITSSSLNHALDALAGLKPGWPNLLELVGLPERIGPHDSRRSAATFFENRGQGSYASALLDHKVVGFDKMSEQVAAVTQSTYSAADRIIFKAEALKLWHSAILPHYERAKLDPRVKAAVEVRRAVLENTKKNGLAKRAKTIDSKRAKATRNRSKQRSRLSALASIDSPIVSRTRLNDSKINSK